MNYSIDTIAAISTPLGRGGIGIIRVSGKLVLKIMSELLKTIPKPRQATYLSCLDKNGLIIDHAIILFFSKPNSFTGEDILEIHGHGGQMILDLLLDRVLEISPQIRLANPGEFSERAFLNEKIDLIQAESIADIIDATSHQSARFACNSLQGYFSNQIHIVLNKLSNLRTYIESSIDFSDQEIDIISTNQIKNILKEIIQDIKKIYQSACSGALIKDGIKVVISGKPNAGKSSLFNALTNIDRAIVSSISGTTRDILYECIQLNGIAFHITDTAGLKKNFTNEIELLSTNRTKNELIQADHILWVIDSNDPHDKKHDHMLYCIQEIYSILNNNQNIPITIIRNKSDLSLEKNGINIIYEKYTCITLSVLLQHGINILKKHLYDSFIKKNKKYLDQNDTVENQSNFIARKRHINILKKAHQYLLSAQSNLKTNLVLNDCFAEDLQQAHNELNKMFGKFTSDDLLKKIFNSFCIGK